MAKIKILVLLPLLAFGLPYRPDQVVEFDEKEADEIISAGYGVEAKKGAKVSNVSSLSDEAKEAKEAIALEKAAKLEADNLAVLNAKAEAELQA